MESFPQSAAQILDTIQRDIKSTSMSNDETLGKIQLYLAQNIYALESEVFGSGAVKLGGLQSNDFNEAKLELLHRMLDTLEDTDTTPPTSDRLETICGLIDDELTVLASAEVENTGGLILNPQTSDFDHHTPTSANDQQLASMSATNAHAGEDTAAGDMEMEQKQNAEVSAEAKTLPCPDCGGQKVTEEQRRRALEKEEERRCDWYALHCD